MQLGRSFRTLASRWGPGIFVDDGATVLDNEEIALQVIGLTGGIGSGKSTVGGLLAKAGANVIDADQVAREVVRPGQPALQDIAQEFGPDILTADGGLDRAAMAAIVFAEPDRRRALELITHPRISERIGILTATISRAEIQDGRPRLVVVEHPLLVEMGQGGHYEALVVVLAPEELRVARLVARGLTETDARARIAVQATDDQRRAAATHIIDNAGSLDDLRNAVDGLLAELEVVE